MGLIYRRDSKSIYEEKEYKQGMLQFLYQNVMGRCLLKIAILPSFSRMIGKYYDSKRSINKISTFIETNQIDMSQFQEKEYTSFNDFFTRQKKEIVFDSQPNAFCSPADAKLCVYPISTELKIQVKHTVYSLEELLQKEVDVNEFQNGNCLVFRLAVDDYHRYHYVDDGEVVESYHINGKLHTVRSISEKYRVYVENVRNCSTLQTKNFGRIYQIEVGAIMVGKIQNHDKKEFHRGDEKGFFEYGGSTIIVLTKNNIKIDQDILEKSQKGIETKVCTGEKIGVQKNNL